MALPLALLGSLSGKGGSGPMAGLGALAKLGTGLWQGIQANKIDRNNIRPIEEVQKEYYENVADAEQLARMGMPAEQYNLAKQGIQRNQSTALNTLSRSSNPSSGLNALLRASNDATLNLDANNAAQRVANRRYLAGQKLQLAGQKKAAFDWNRKSDYLAKYAKAEALRGSGIQNLMSGFGDVQQIGAMGGGGSNGGESGTPNFYNTMNKYGNGNYNTTNGVIS